MKSRVNEWVDQFPKFHELTATEQIVRLVYFHTIEEKRGTISREELQQLFEFIDVTVPDNLPQLLTHLCGRGARLLNRGGEYSLRREIRQAIENELQKLKGGGPPPKIGPVPAFEFAGRAFKDAKVKILLDETGKCYANECWNACGILMRIVIERTLDSVDPRMKVAGGLRDRLNIGISTAGLFSRTMVDTLKELRNAKLVGDIVAHHSSIVVEKPDIDLVVPPLRMLIKEVTTV